MKPLWDAPEVGSVWKERRRQYAGRRVQVTDVSESFVYISTLRTSNGREPLREVNTRVRLNLWASTFEPVEGSL